MLIVCSEDAMESIKKRFMEIVNCDDIGEMKEYIGTKVSIDQHNNTLRIMHPVLVQSLNDEFNFAKPNSKPEMLATAGAHLMNSGPKLCEAAQTRYCSGVGKLLYLVKWSQLEILNSNQELMHFMTEAYPNCTKGMEHVMQHVLSRPERGMVMQPDGVWDGGQKFEFQID